MYNGKYGGVSIESCEVADDEIILTYKNTGMIEWRAPDFYDENNQRSYSYSLTVPVYDRNTDLYTLIYTFVDSLKNAKDMKTSIID